jgi:uncharacterized membrane protein
LQRTIPFLSPSRNSSSDGSSGRSLAHTIPTVLRNQLAASYRLLAALRTQVNHEFTLCRYIVVIMCNNCPKNPSQSYIIYVKTQVNMLSVSIRHHYLTNHHSSIVCKVNEKYWHIITISYHDRTIICKWIIQLAHPPTHQSSFQSELYNLAQHYH